MNTALYQEAALASERSAETLRIRADRLQAKAEGRRAKANRQKAKAIKLERAAADLRSAAEGKVRQASDYRRVAVALPALERNCLGCVLGYVPRGETYNSIHSCGQTVGVAKSA